MATIITKSMCEALIKAKLQEIADIYRRYNPDGKSISIAMNPQIGGIVMAFNTGDTFGWKEDMEHPFDIKFNVK